MPPYKYENLQVYKSTFDLLLLLYQRTQRMPREYRYTLCQEAKASLHEALFRIYMASLNAADQPRQIPEALHAMSRFVVYFRLMERLCHLSQKDVDLMGATLAHIHEQLRKWNNYILKRHVPESANS
jgi:hypothetical protein